jgi:apolipoprotein N-acyltransferase
VFGGIVGHMANSLIVGIIGIALLTAVFDGRPNPVAAAAIGAAYGIAVEAIVINWIINTQKIQTLYSSTPH